MGYTEAGSKTFKKRLHNGEVDNAVKGANGLWYIPVSFFKENGYGHR